MQNQVDRIAHVLRMRDGTGARQPRAAARRQLPDDGGLHPGRLKAGCVAVPTMPLLRARELGIIIDKARVNAVLCARRPARGAGAGAQPAGATRGLFRRPAADSLEALMARMPPRFEAVDTAADDVCLISFTSGTTGVPKGTMHFHRDVLAICDCFPRSTLATRRTTSSSARRRWPSPSASAACCCSRCAWARPPCCWKS
jgi:2-aminobenzoate-CoA ligase